LRRTPSFWQAVVLLLVFTATVGSYAMVVLAWPPSGGDKPLVIPTSPPHLSDVVQILAPLDGAVLQALTPLTLRAAVIQAGFVRAEVGVDGTQVAAAANADPQAVPWALEWTLKGMGEGSHVFAVRASRPVGEWETSTPITVTVVPAGQLLFSSNRDGSYALYTMQTDRSAVRRLTLGPGDAREPASRTNTALAYVADTGTGPTLIRQMQIGAQGVSDLLLGRDPAWSLQGERLAYAASVGGVSQVHAIAAKGSVASQLTAEKVYAGQPTWSADGSQVAYVAERERNWDIWVTALDGSETYSLTDDAAMDWAPAWSPDGSRLAFVSDRGGSHQIYIMRADGTEVQPLTYFPQGAESPAWSPDGFWLVFVAYTGSGVGINARELYLIRADGQYQVRLTRNGYDDTEPEWVRGP
jgi:dipeptidyl aminopeptidase/acylaminoacyl peptidase